MKKFQAVKEKVSKAVMKASTMKIAGLTLAGMSVFTTSAFAAGPEYGKNAGTWITGQLFWVALIVVAVALVGLLAKKMWTGAVITGLAGSVVLVFIEDPEKLKNIGTTLWGVISGT